MKTLRNKIITILMICSMLAALLASCAENPGRSTTHDEAGNIDTTLDFGEMQYGKVKEVSANTLTLECAYLEDYRAPDGSAYTEEDIEADNARIIAEGGKILYEEDDPEAGTAYSVVEVPAPDWKEGKGEKPSDEELEKSMTRDAYGPVLDSLDFTGKEVRITAPDGIDIISLLDRPMEVTDIHVGYVLAYKTMPETDEAICIYLMAKGGY